METSTGNELRMCGGVALSYVRYADEMPCLAASSPKHFSFLRLFHAFMKNATQHTPGYCTTVACKFHECAHIKCNFVDTATSPGSSTPNKLRNAKPLPFVCGPDSERKIQLRDEDHRGADFNEVKCLVTTFA